jgi:hypothetical protein
MTAHVVIEGGAILALATLVVLIAGTARYRKVGGLHFVQVGRLGFCCYVSRRARGRRAGSSVSPQGSRSGHRRGGKAEGARGIKERSRSHRRMQESVVGQDVMMESSLRSHDEAGDLQNK